MSDSQINEVASDAGPATVTEFNDQYTGVGGAYVVLADGRRVPADPATGEPLLEPAAAAVDVKRKGAKS